MLICVKFRESKDRKRLYFFERDKRVRTPPGRPQGSPLPIRILPRPYYDHGLAQQAAPYHSKGRSGGDGMWGPLRLPWGGVWSPWQVSLAPSLH